MATHRKQSSTPTQAQPDVRNGSNPPARPSERLPQVDSQAQEVFLHLWRCYDRLKAIEDEVFNRFGLSAQQYNALRLLQAAASDGLPTMDLGRRLISRAPDTTRMLDRLEQRGLVSRCRRPDNRRMVVIFITDAGRQLLNELSPLVFDMHERQLGHLSPAQQRQLVKLLKFARKPHEDATCDWLEQ